MITFFKHINRLIESAGNKKIASIFLLTLFSGFFEVVGIASIMPFIAVLSQPGIIKKYSILSSLYESFGFLDINNFLIVLGGCILIIMVFVNGLGAITLWVTAKFAYAQGDYISRRLLEQYLSKPYTYFLEHNSADMVKEIQTESQDLVQFLLIPLVLVMVRVTISVFIFCFLIYIDPFLAIAVFAFMGCAYGLIYFSVHNKLRCIGKIRTQSLSLRYKIMAEAFAAIKEVKLYGTENHFIHRYEKPSKMNARANIGQHVISQLPQYAVETTAFGSIMVMVLYLIMTQGSFGSALPIVAAYAFAAQRLLPAIKRIFDGVTYIRSYTPVLEKVSSELGPSVTHPKSLSELVKKTTENPLSVLDNITLEEISFSYENALFPVISNLNLSIKANSTVGFVGTTGCGKTTLLDLIIGLLSPTKGRILIDGKPMTKDNVRAWQSGIGFVPQYIHLSDQSILCNIAFGISPDEVDIRAAQQAATIANIHDFIIRELPEGYDTLIGENGVRLSGGQRQRIGIARALYKNPAILVFDEATSALDIDTETVVMDAIANLNHKKTILIVAHRPDTLKVCDVIIELDKIDKQKKSANNHDNQFNAQTNIQIGTL